MIPISMPVSLSDFIIQVKAQLESDHVARWIVGEIGQLTRAPSGHCYFTLKDGAVTARAVMWRAKAFAFQTLLKEGAHVEVLAHPTLYEARAEFQLSVEAVRLCGQGPAFERFLRLKALLTAEGLFDADRKRALPLWPERVGIVTSTQAAALRDVIAVFRRRNPTIALILYPTPVQGDEASETIAATIRMASRRAECDAIIVCRGGGSFEDLVAFNDEAVARAIAESPIPIVTGIGHETDVTIADFVADYRAATPTAAAERLSPSLSEAIDRLRADKARLRQGLGTRLQSLEIRLDRARFRLVSPTDRIAHQGRTLEKAVHVMGIITERRYREVSNRCHRLVTRLNRSLPDLSTEKRRFDSANRNMIKAMGQRLDNLSSNLSHQQKTLIALDPMAILARGYSITQDRFGRVLTCVNDLSIHEAIITRLHSGRFTSLVDKIDDEND